MATKHWHLTNVPNRWNERGGPIASRKEAVLLVQAVGRHSSRPVYIEPCTSACLVGR